MPLTVTAAQVAAAFPEEAEIYPGIAGTALTAGQSLRIGTSDGKFYPANGTGAATAGFRGVALSAASAGKAVNVLKRGHMYGLDLSGVDYDAQLFVDNAAGAIGSAAGSATASMGRVVALSDHSRTKVAYIEAEWR